MRRRTRYLRRLFGMLVVVALTVALGALVPRPLWQANEAGVLDRHILVLTNPIHTDIAVPIDDSVRETFAFLGEAGMPIDAAAARYIVFGWGSRAFYIGTPTWADLKPGPLFKGLTLDQSAMHVDVIGAVVEPHPAIRRYSLDSVGFDNLIRFIGASFATGDDGRPMLIPDTSYGAYDRFYEANGWFTALLGCNTWTARALRIAGFRTGWWNPLPVTLNWSLGLYNRKAVAADAASDGLGISAAGRS